MKLPHLRVVAAAAALAVVSLSVSACGDSTAGSASTTAAADGSWPRTIVHEAGETVIESRPQNIVSTSLSVTGTLLAIGAPVTASAATSTTAAAANDLGFFSQWSDVAAERGVKVLYPNLEFDLEAVIAADPDLVVVSTSGADSTLEQYDQLAKLFPTIVVDYSDQTWQDLAVELGKATGLEAEAEAVIAKFDESAAAAAKRITAPDGGVTVMTYNGAGSESGIAMATGPHAQLLGALGLEVIPSPTKYDTSARGKRSDTAFVTFENLSAAIGGKTIFLINADDATVTKLLTEPTLVNLPAVASKQVYSLGPSSFRIDYYSGLEIIDLVVGHLG